MTYRNESLQTFILRIFQPVVDSISGLENIWLKFVDHSGKYVVTPKTKEQCLFCQYIRSSKEGNRRCLGSCKQAVFMGRTHSPPFFIQCHAGLSVLAVPIIMEGRNLGGLAIGEIVDKPKSYILQRLSGLGLNDKNLADLADLYEDIPVIGQNRVSKLAETLYQLSNNFIKIGVALAQSDHYKREFNKNDLLSEYRQCIEFKQNSLNLPAVANNNVPSLHMQKLISDAEKYITNNYDKPIDLKDVANFIHLNHTYFSYLFRHVTGYTFKNYLTQLRIEKAKQFLLNSSLTVTEIAKLVGYPDNNYFSRIFKKETGCPPSYYYKLKKIQI